MKFERAVALTLPSKPCQRPGCPNLGRMRLQVHKRITWSGPFISVIDVWNHSWQFTSTIYS